MTSYDYDLFTIGAGSGGVRASRVAAGYGARVAVVEERYLGGTCVNVGCIPKKLFVYASQIREEVEIAASYGSTFGSQSFRWSTLLENKNREIERLNRVYARLLDEAGVDRIEGRARLVDAHTVAVGERSFRAETILIASGSWPTLPDIPGIEHAITSNEAFHLKEIPRRVLVVGGGYIAVEFAGIYHGLGSQVTQLYRGPLFLRGFDGDVRRFLAEQLRGKGIDLRFECNAAAIEPRGGCLWVTLTDGSAHEADQVLFATGRAPNTADLGLEEIGVALDAKGAVLVDELSRTNVANVYAIGDCTDRVNLTPVAIHEGVAFARTVFGGDPTRPDHEGVPSCVFSQPAIGTVGLTEEEARSRCGEVEIYRSTFRPLKHTLTELPEKTFMKLVVDPGTDRVLGCHMVGPEAGEIIQGFAVALKCGATKAQFDATVGIHPTSAEEFVTMREAAPSA